MLATETIAHVEIKNQNEDKLQISSVFSNSLGNDKTTYGTINNNSRILLLLVDQFRVDSEE